MVSTTTPPLADALSLTEDVLFEPRSGEHEAVDLQRRARRATDDTLRAMGKIELPFVGALDAYFRTLSEDAVDRRVYPSVSRASVLLNRDGAARIDILLSSLHSARANDDNNIRRVFGSDAKMTEYGVMLELSVRAGVREATATLDGVSHVGVTVHLTNWRPPKVSIEFLLELNETQTSKHPLSKLLVRTTSHVAGAV